MSDFPEWGCDGKRCQMYDDCRDGVCEMAAVWDKAILAERERCAEIAERMHRDLVGYTTDGSKIASAIRGTS